ncbi:hypothetical protein Ancab_006337 [Ancistrocladus abbreviatus]
MVIELCPDNSSRGMSPRISFSHDFNQTDGVPIEPQPSSPLLHSSDFDFCIRKSYDYDQESSSADELFSNGIILPSQIKRKSLPTKNIIDRSNSLPPPPLLSPVDDDLKEEGNDKQQQEQQQQQQQSSKSFWGFKRSRSLNCVSIYGRGLCPLPPLSRSKSTGSASTSAKKSLFDRHNNNSTTSSSRKQNAQKNSSSAMKFSQNSSSSIMTHQKPPLRKNYGQFSNYGVTVTPVLNVPSANLLGLGSIFSAKEKGKKK